MYFPDNLSRINHNTHKLTLTYPIDLWSDRIDKPASDGGAGPRGKRTRTQTQVILKHTFGFIQQLLFIPMHC